MPFRHVTAIAAFVAAGGRPTTTARPIDPLTAPGVSRQLAANRAALVSNIRYEMNLSLEQPDTARGHVVIRFHAKKSADVIVDFRGTALSNVMVNGVGAATTFNGAHVVIPATVVRPGENVVAADFETLIAPAGAAIIKVHDDKDGANYLYTLLVPSDANLLFPCFDQPDLKARLTLTLVIPSGWSAMANGTTESSEPENAHSVVRFHETDLLPTYLFAFAAGPWKQFADGPRSTPLWVRASRAKEVEVDSLQSQVGSALTSLERYFGVPYPFQQFQYMLAPAFPFGGMEHPGLTMFSEESFIFREPPTLNRRLGRRSTIYHEVAHQWFGDYVTMKWFDDLWLKEGFATYMAAKMQAIEGQPNPWMSFYLRIKPPAYEVDQTAGTTPVWQRLDNLDQAKSNYGAIVYNKAPAILKQLNYLVGDSAFRAGVHDFLVTHPYGNATWQDLLGAIGKAAHRSLADWGRAYILRPGMPVVEQQLEINDGKIKRLRLVQHAAQDLSGPAPWPMRTEVVIWSHGASASIPVEIHAETTVVTAAAGRPAPDFVFANANDNAYGLVMLDPRSAAWVAGHITEVGDPFLRAMLWGAMWDLVRDARLAPATFLATALAALPTEQDEQIASGIVSRLSTAASTYLSAEQQQALAESLESTLLRGASDSLRAYGLRKDHLDAYIATARSGPAIERLVGWLDSTSAGGLRLLQPTRWSIVSHLIERRAPGAEALLAAETRRDTTTGGKRSAFIAAAARPDPVTKHDYFARYFSDSTLNEDWATASLRTFNAQDDDTLTRSFLIPALDSLPWIQKNRRIFFLGSWISGFVGGQRSPEALSAIDAFLAGRPNLPRDLRQKILQSRDALQRTVRIRARYAGGAGISSRAMPTVAVGSHR
jgi:aminopeptidase N